jgi:hypothetical protein
MVLGHIEANSLPVQEQYGFRSHSSTEKASFTYIRDCQTLNTKNVRTLYIYLDRLKKIHKTPSNTNACRIYIFQMQSNEPCTHLSHSCVFFLPITNHTKTLTKSYVKYQGLLIWINVCGGGYNYVAMPLIVMTLLKTKSPHREHIEKAFIITHICNTS